MPTQEERLSNLELAHKDIVEAVKDINHYVTMMYGVVGQQGVDIRETKISLRSVNERLEIVDRRLDSQDKKLDQILALLSTLSPKSEQ
jgi:peptidoglycan hydrolase CwlO-like protein